jgi:SAM-dependent methyltransferase
MNYEKFAYMYDKLMSDAPYDQWVSFVLEVMKQNEIVNGKILDVGCGTGNIAIPLSELALAVTAVDLSAEMLMIAQAKSQEKQTDVKFFQQDMRELEGLGTFDVVISLCDSINYLNNQDEVATTFQGVYDHLNNSGIFIFDVHSIYKIDEIFRGNTFADSGEEIAYIWECFAGESDHSIEHELSFFMKNERGLYERFDELHKQRTYPIEVYKQALENTGFTVEQVTGDFSLATLPKNSLRWFFVAKKA